MAEDLYETDFLAWTEAQAERLRRLARGEAVADLDWPNVIEEVEAAGRGELRRVETHFIAAITYALKTVAWPGERIAVHWTDEVYNHLLMARGGLDEGIPRRLDVEDMFEMAVLQAGRVLRIYGEPARPWPSTAPFTLAELCDEGVRSHNLIARLQAAVPPA